MDRNTSNIPKDFKVGQKIYYLQHSGIGKIEPVIVLDPKASQHGFPVCSWKKAGGKPDGSGWYCLFRTFEDAKNELVMRVLELKEDN